jgi:hypothetical protein
MLQQPAKIRDHRGNLTNDECFCCNLNFRTIS